MNVAVKYDFKQRKMHIIRFLYVLLLWHYLLKGKTNKVVYNLRLSRHKTIKLNKHSIDFYTKSNFQLDWFVNYVGKIYDYTFVKVWGITRFTRVWIYNFVSFANVSKLVNQLVTKINKDNITAYKTINR